jgi:hypothetical protein
MPRAQATLFDRERDRRTTTIEKESAMAVEHIEVGKVNDEDELLTVTLRGKPEQLVKALVHGLPRASLVALQEALGAELNARARKVAGQEPTRDLARSGSVGAG